jgi:hypothetical protein
MVATAQAHAGRKTAAYLDEAIRELYEQAFRPWHNLSAAWVVRWNRPKTFSTMR